MKVKYFFMLISLIVVLILLSGCPAIMIIPKNYAAFEVSVVEWMTGPALEGAAVKVFDAETEELLGTALTDSNGRADLTISWLQTLGTERIIDILVSKEGFAPSAVKGLKITGGADSENPVNNGVVEMATNRARIDPDSEELPSIDVEFGDLAGNPVDLTQIATDTVVATITSGEYWDVLYAGLDYIPWAQKREGSSFGEKEASFNISTTGRDGENVFHVVVYDYNRARVDYLFYWNIDLDPETITEKYAPTGLWIYSWTRDNAIEFYSEDPIYFSSFSREIHFKPEDAPKDGNIFVYVIWDAPATTTDIVGYNVYRSDDGGSSYKKIAFTTSTYTFDNGIGLASGNTYYYSVRSVYSDGTESADSNIVELTPLDIFKTKLISPADSETGVSRTPTFTWKPVDKDNLTDLADVGCGVIPDSSITYYYLIWIYDTNQSECHYFPSADSTSGGFETTGATQVSVTYGDASWQANSLMWIYIGEDGNYYYAPEALEAYKTYEWGMDYAVAEYIGDDDDGDGYADVVQYSITADLGYGYDLWTNEDEYYNRFTTGEE